MGFNPYCWRPNVVEQDRFEGTCYRAANWVDVGSTQGRGRQDRDRTYSSPIKKMYLYALEADVRKVLCREPQPEERGFEIGIRRDCRQTGRRRKYGTVRYGRPAVEQEGRSALGKLFYDHDLRPISQQMDRTCQTRAETKATYRSWISLRQVWRKYWPPITKRP